MRDMVQEGYPKEAMTIEAAQGKETLLEINNLVVKYVTDEEVVHAVNGINLSMTKGETLGIVGETGAGKTTTALSVLRLLPARTAVLTADSICYRGRNILEFTDREMRDIRGQEISMIFQDPMTSLNPVMKVGKQIAEVLVLHNEAGRSKSEIDQEVDRILQLVGIPPDRKHEYPHQFSGGMKQRIVIAIALACNPNLLIADEPTTALDVTIQAQVLDMMEKLKEELDTSMILITHDLGIVAETCDTVVIMYAGEIIEKGTVYDIFEGLFHHPYTVGLFNSIPSIEDDRDRLTPIRGLMPNPADLPPGCHFAPRCQSKMPICEEISPSAHEFGSHCISCHLYADREEG